MKLLIKREQESGMLGGISFLLTARVELDSNEMDIIKKYKAQKMTLLTRTHPIFGTLNTKIEDLTGGIKFKCKDVSEILECENLVKETCRNFDTIVKVMANFGGEEVIDFNEE